MASLAGRLSASLAASLIALLTLQWLIASIAIEKLTEGQLLARLAHDAENLLAGVAFDPNGVLHLDPRRIDTAYERPFSGHYYIIAGSDDRQISRSLWDAALDAPAVAPGKETVIHAAGPQQQRLLVLTRGFRKQDHAISISVAEDLNDLKAGLRRFQLVNGAVSALILVALLWLQRRILRRALQPLEQVRRDMVRLERGEIARIEANGPSEIAPLISELNRLLSMMTRRTRRSREALGNLAHALKTRLAIVNQTAEGPELSAHAHARSAIRESTAAMRRIIERELKRARLIGEALPGERVNLRDELTLLSKTLQVLHARKAPVIAWELDDKAVFSGDREDLMELLGNLLDNACQWCRRQVSLTVTAEAGIVFIVEDDGVGCTPEQIDSLTQRGFRADESAPGSGLGLAIVRDVVESYDGRLILGRSAALGGLRVEVRLPAPGH
jgi:signal transduction histidine kinase